MIPMTYIRYVFKHVRSVWAGCLSQVLTGLVSWCMCLRKFHIQPRQRLLHITQSGTVNFK
jgi:hypothetical protein